ncbi:oxygen-dependent choline dehydrogenase-like [Oppia nitens]|uniref:oxygen-dependent choline dehydrogenase-like n=1 Tax=Oppia nitens TaxID=1686743 RepID=UPI0023DC96E7|nr:oxygen-dependent choline dehydrogenase-like [Oppia nitens]
MYSTTLLVRLYMVYTIIWQRQQRHNYMANRTPVPTKQSYDYIVVGGGSAGAIVACRLSQWFDQSFNSTLTSNVLLLESGGAPDALFDDIPALGLPYMSLHTSSYRFVTIEPQKHVGHSYPNNGREVEVWGRVLGGSSTVNGMGYNRGNRKYYDSIVEKYGAIGWDYSSVLPVFKLMENNTDPRVSDDYHGRDGPVGVSTPELLDPIFLKQSQIVQSEWGLQLIDINGSNQSGFAIGQFTYAQGIRSSTNSAYLENTKLCPNLTIVTGALVSKVIIDDNKTTTTTTTTNADDGIGSSRWRALGVEFSKQNQTFRVMANKEVILSAGPISSPQILMLSGVGPVKHLNDMSINKVYSDLPVGDNYCNHIVVRLDFPILLPSLVQPVLSIDNSTQLIESTLWGQGAMAQTLSTITYLSSKHNPDPNYPDINLLTKANSKSTTRPSMQSSYMPKQYMSNHTSIELHRQLANYSAELQSLSGDYLTIFAGLMRPKSCGTIRLKTLNISDQPIIDSQFLSNPIDKYRLREAIQEAFRLVETTSFSEYVQISRLPVPPCSYCPSGPVYQCISYLDCLIYNWAYNQYHPVGTCRMGDQNRSDTVVDPRLRVIGVRGLRVVDSSVYPDIMNGNTAAAALLAGEMGARLIHEDNTIDDNNQYKQLNDNNNIDINNNTITINCNTTR